MAQLAKPVDQTPARTRLESLLRITFWLAIALFFKLLGSIVFEYRNYFPANFESSFLSGKRFFFHGSYRAAFYVHIISGPVALLISAFLMFSGGNKSFRSSLRRWHAVLGKSLLALVLFAMLPSGLVMASRAFTGPIAGAGFVALTILLSVCIVMAGWHAKKRRFAVHQLWATRSFILLCSPLLLRLMTGATIVLDIESAWTYRFAAWGSWLIPLAIFETQRMMKQRKFQFGTGVMR